MSPLFLLAAALATLALGGLLLWALRGSSRRAGNRDGLKVLETAPRHLCSMATIRQALDEADLQYASAKGGARLASTLRRERRRVALMYLLAIRGDFEQALHIARVVAVLSPQVSGPQEYERLKLTLIFRCRFHLLRMRLILGNFALPELTALGQMVTSTTSELEAAIAALGERSALAAELAIQSER